MHGDRKLFEMLTLEGAQAGLSWLTILKKRENYRRAFDRFDPQKVARYDKRKIERLMLDAGIVRNRAKIVSTVANAKAFLAIREEYGTFNKFVWRFVDGAEDQPLAWHEAATGQDGRVGCHEPRTEEARHELRRADDLLCLHAGGGHGQRPHHRLFSLQ